MEFTVPRGIVPDNAELPEPRNTEEVRVFQENTKVIGFKVEDGTLSYCLQYPYSGTVGTLFVPPNEIYVPHMRVRFNEELRQFKKNAISWNRTHPEALDSAGGKATQPPAGTGHVAASSSAMSAFNREGELVDDDQIGAEVEVRGEEVVVNEVDDNEMVHSSMEHGQSDEQDMTGVESQTETASSSSQLNFDDFRSSTLFDEESVPSTSTSQPATRLGKLSASSSSGHHPTPIETQLQPLRPHGSDSDPVNKKRRRQKRKEEEESATHSNWEGGSGYISEQEGDPVKRRSMRLGEKPLNQEVPKHVVVSPPPRVRHHSSSAAGSSRNCSADQLLQIQAFPEAPQTSVEKTSRSTAVPILSSSITKSKTKRKSAKTDDDQSDDYCFICMDGGAVICCDYCPKVFHISCHVPVLQHEPSEVRWQCNSCTTKRAIDKEILKFPDCGESSPLTETNRCQFQIACKFVMESYKIKEVPTMRWRFPKGYLKVYGKVPYNLKYIKDRLCLGEPEPFGSVEEMMQAFKQMLTQAYIYHELHEPKYLQYAGTYFFEVLNLVRNYYPAHADLFDEHPFEKTQKTA